MAAAFDRPCQVGRNADAQHVSAAVDKRTDLVAGGHRRWVVTMVQIWNIAVAKRDAHERQRLAPPRSAVRLGKLPESHSLPRQGRICSDFRHPLKASAAIAPRIRFRQ